MNHNASSRLGNLAEKYQSGDNVAGEALSQHLRSQFMTRFSIAGLATSEAEDLAQTCLMDVVISVNRYNQELGSVETWAAGIARNGLRNHFRRRSIAQRFEMPESVLEEVQAPELPEMETIEAIRLALETLNLVDQELLRMRFSLGLSFTEIAVSADLTEANARKRVSRAVDQLRRLPEIQATLLA